MVGMTRFEHAGRAGGGSDRPRLGGAASRRARRARGGARALLGPLALVLALAPWARPAAAQDGSDAAAPPADEAARQEAAERFRRALALFDEGNMEAALIEFEAAYARMPSWQVLYNIGACHRALGHPVEAVDAWERYLREGGDEVPEARREELAAALEEQRGRIGTLLVRTNVEGARVTIDGVAVATAPLEEPLRLAVGSYRVGVEAAGWEGPVRRVVIAGESREVLDVLLERVATERGSLEIESAVPDVEVRVDGEVVGTTPLTETVPVAPGTHRVEGRRAGFETFRRDVEVDAGQLSTVALELSLDPDAAPEGLGTLSLALPDAPHALRVNGAEVEAAGGDVTLPAGRHHLVLEVDERVPFRRTVEVDAGGRLELAPALRWTDTARSQRLNDAERLRVAGWSVFAAGMIGLAVGGVSAGLAEGHYAGIKDENFEDWSICNGAAGTLCNDEAERAYENADFYQQVFRWTYGIAFGLGALATTVGLVMVIAAPSESAIDAAARAAVRLEVGPGSLRLRGRF
jgi:hypothetical protein